MNTHIIPIDHDLRGQLEHRLVSKHGMTSTTANAALDDMLGYLHIIAHNPGCGLGPSEIVDTAWHEFILHTQDYMDYCAMAFGDYIHHHPNRQGEVGRPIHETAAFMASNGIVYDPELWGMTAKCSNPGPGCKNTCAECGRRPKADPRTPCAIQDVGDTLVMSEARADCDDGRGGGPSGCTGPGNCS